MRVIHKIRRNIKGIIPSPWMSLKKSKKKERGADKKIEGNVKNSGYLIIFDHIFIQSFNKTFDQDKDLSQHQDTSEYQ